jgi:hypothetical protein
MTWTILTGAKTVSGSIKRSVNYSQIDADVVLEEAQTLIYSILRVREMRSLWAPTVAIGDSTKALPTGFLDPIGKLRDTENFRYRQVTEDELLGRRIYSSLGVLESGQPSCWTILDEAVTFDLKFDTAKTLNLPYYKSLSLLSVSNTTNFLTNRYPHVLRQACRVQAHAFMKNWAGFNAELPLLTALIEKTNAEADMSYRGGDYDSE